MDSESDQLERIHHLSQVSHRIEDAFSSQNSAQGEENHDRRDEISTVSSGRETSCSTDGDNVINYDYKLFLSSDTTSKSNGKENLPVSIGDISLLQESSDLHWFSEDDLERESLAQTESDIPKPSLSSKSTGYEAIARDRDASLAQIDMETFKSEDINHIYRLPREQIDMNSSSLYLENGGEEFASMSGSVLEELTLNDHYIDISSSGIINRQSSDCSTMESSLEGTPPHLSLNRVRAFGQTSVLEAGMDILGVSADSLDLSSVESNTRQMVLRCREHDKTKYKIAFEESVSSIKSDYRGNDGDQCQSRYASGETYPSKIRNSRKKPKDQMTKSEYSYTTWNQVKKKNLNGKFFKRDINLKKDSFRDEAKQSQSMPDIMHSGLHISEDPNFIPLGHYNRLYDLHNTTTSSSNSEISPPRSLIRLFIQNRRSPSSCSPASSSTSCDENLNESSDSNMYSTPARSPKLGDAPPFFQRMKNRVHVHSVRNDHKLQVSEDAFEDSLVSDENANLLPKPFHERKIQASPIREEENEQTDASSQCDTENPFCKEIGTETDGFPCWNGKGNLVNGKNSNFISARRSISVDRFVSPSAPSYGNFFRRNTENGFSNLNKVRREFGSLSSGYHSSRQCLNDSHRNQNQENITRKYISNILVVTSKTASTQIPVHIQDKQVQASLSDEEHKGFVWRDHYSVGDKSGSRKYLERSSPTAEPQSQTKQERPLYVCFPNYSLPDLNFLKNLSNTNSPAEDRPTTIHLSPTKLDLPSRQVTPGIMRRNIRRGVRPKSCTDYENMIANRSFKHIKDWDSLKVLLPNEFKSLIARLEGEHGSSIGRKVESKDLNNNEGAKSDCRASQVTSQKPNVLLRPTKVIRRANSSDTCRSRHCHHTINKRHSLQEPLYGEFLHRYIGDCSQADVNHGHFPCYQAYSHHANSALTRSATMPSCACNSNQPYHHACGEAMVNPIPSCCNGPKHTIKDLFEMDSSEDRLCNLFSKGITIKEFASIITGGSNGCYRTGRLTSPLNPYAPIKEQAEESESFFQKNEDVGKLEPIDANTSSFKDLKRRWEAASTSSTTNPGIFSRGSKVEDKFITDNLFKEGKPEVTGNKHLVTLRSKSNGTTVAKRPTSLGFSGFKSMIPVAKGGKVSPTGAKITSPSRIPIFLSPKKT